MMNKIMNTCSLGLQQTRIITPNQGFLIRRSLQTKASPRLRNYSLPCLTGLLGGALLGLAAYEIKKANSSRANFTSSMKKWSENPDNQAGQTAKKVVGYAILCQHCGYSQVSGSFFGSLSSTNETVEFTDFYEKKYTIGTDGEYRILDAGKGHYSIERLGEHSHFR